jgi:hypothetical protein
MRAHGTTLFLVSALSLHMSHSATSDNELEGSCPADSLVLQGKCSSHFEVPTGIFNASWLDNADAVDRIADALQTGRVVILRHAVTGSAASGMRDELIKFGKEDFELKESHDHANIKMPDRSIWKGSSMQVCTNVSTHFHQYTKVSPSQICSRQHHLKDISMEKSPHLSSFLEFMKSTSMQRLIATLAGACENVTGSPGDCDLSQLPNVPNAKIGEVSHDIFWQQKGDYIGTTRDARPGWLISATYYLSDDQFSGTKHGGNLIWCAPFQRISPDFNTLVLYRVSRQSWHVVQPVVNKSPDSRGISFWYKMPGGETVNSGHSFAQEWAAADFRDTMSPAELGAEIRKKEKAK